MSYPAEQKPWICVPAPQARPSGSPGKRSCRKTTGEEAGWPHPTTFSLSLTKDVSIVTDGDLGLVVACGILNTDVSTKEDHLPETQPPAWISKSFVIWPCFPSRGWTRASCPPSPHLAPSCPELLQMPQMCSLPAWDNSAPGRAQRVAVSSRTLSLKAPINTQCPLG